MNIKTLKKAGAALLIIALFSGSLPTDHSHAAVANSNYEKVWTTEPPADVYTQKLGQVSAMTFTLDMWHYSGGYWKVGNKGADKIQINDNDFKVKEISVMTANNMAEFIGELPEEVKTELAKGNKVITQVRPRAGIALDSMFDINSLKFKITESEMSFSALPKFNFIDTRLLSYWDYMNNPIPNVIIPFVEPVYGYNIYSVFGNGVSAKQVNGWIRKTDPGDMEGMPQGRIHPSMVKDVTGALKSGYQIMIDGVLKDSVGYRIGQGTFNNAGACGMHFEYPVEFIFYAAPNVPEATECDACGDELISGTDEKACSSTSCKDWGKTECGCTVIVDPVVLPPSTSGCNSVITWSETDTSKHTYKCSGCKKRKKTGKKYCPGHQCPHTYTYEATLTADATLTPATLKSGYGFEVKAPYSVSTKQTKNSGKCGKSLTKVNGKKPTAPTKAEVRIGWVYKNEFGSQPKIISMEKVSGANAFEMKKNNLSPQKSRKVFTAIELAGTKTKPAKHNVEIVLAGGGVSGVAEFCKTITKPITINGNMYEDDHTSGGGW